MTGHLPNLRHACRALLRSPTFTIVATLSLAIGIGVNTAIFSAANALLLRPLAYPGADRIAIVWQRSPGLGVPQDWLSTGQFVDIATENHVFERTAAAIGASFNLTGDGAPERVDGIRATADFFPIFGARALLGRVFDRDDDVPGRSPSAILTFGFWTRRFGQDRNIVGKTILLNNTSVTVVGVLSPDFVFGKEVMPAVNGIQRTDLILPLPMPPNAEANRDGEDYNVFVKRKASVSLTQAQAQMNTIAAHMRDRYPQFYPAGGGLTLSVVPLLEQVVGDTRLVLYILLGAVGVVLLVACGNVANLMLSRAASREKDLTVRVALGADRARILGLVLQEGLMLSLAGSLLGLGLAGVCIAALKGFTPADVPRAGEIGIDLRVLGFTGVVAVLSPLLFALAPATRAARVDPSAVLKEGGRAGIGGGALGLRHGRLPRLLILSEVALSIVLLAGAGLLIRSYRYIVDANPGFDARDVLSFRLTLPGLKYRGDGPIAIFYRQLAERIHALPGVRAVGFNYQLPLSSVALAWEPVTVEGFVPRATQEDRVIASSAYVSAEYFAAMSIPLVRGRVFSEQDDANSPPVVVVDDKFVNRFWPNDNPLGKRIRQGTDGPWRVVVGVVKNTSDYQTSAQPPITAYFPVAQYPIPSRFAVVKTAPGADKQLLMTAIGREVRALDPTLPLYDVRAMSDRLFDSLARRRLAMDLLASFALLALTLSAIGTYGVIAYWVEQRRREIGIRMALGADRPRIVLLLVREFGPMVAAGTGVGLVAAAALTRSLTALLFHVHSDDVLTFALLPLTIIGVAIVATLLPARRATRIEPVAALRAD
ncbi:MAG: ABC transporter permease [Gemmatimonadaceae bacterium]